MIKRELIFQFPAVESEVVVSDEAGWVDDESEDAGSVEEVSEEAGQVVDEVSVEAGSVDDEVSPSAAVLFASVEDVVDEEPPESVDVEAETSVVDVLVVSLPVESVAGDALEEEESTFVVVSEAG